METESLNQIMSAIGVLGTKLDNLEAKIDNLEAKIDNVEVKIDNVEVKIVTWRRRLMLYSYCLQK